MRCVSQIIFYAVYRAGGLPLLTAFCAALITTAWLLIWSLMRGPFADRLLLAGLASRPRPVPAKADSRRS